MLAVVSMQTVLLFGAWSHAVPDLKEMSASNRAVQTHPSEKQSDSHTT